MELLEVFGFFKLEFQNPELLLPKEPFRLEYYFQKLRKQGTIGEDDFLKALSLLVRAIEQVSHIPPPGTLAEISKKHSPSPKQSPKETVDLNNFVLIKQPYPKAHRLVLQGSYGEYGFLTIFLSSRFASLVYFFPLEKLFPFSIFKRARKREYISTLQTLF
ncbi:MAG: hypothetical protein ACUVQZ_04100 [Candidatus Caldatribacteriaceae bacterium]